MQIGVEAQRAVENRRVFVVDADEVRRTALQFMLADENETHEFASFAPALEKGERWRPDLVLLGGEAAQQAALRLPDLRARWPGVRVILVRSATDPGGAGAVDPAHADDTLGPALELASVRRTVDRWLGRRPAWHVPVRAT
jgi:chemotaxis response regulator CheB